MEFNELQKQLSQLDGSVMIEMKKDKPSELDAMEKKLFKLEEELSNMEKELSVLEPKIQVPNYHHQWGSLSLYEKVGVQFAKKLLPALLKVMAAFSSMGPIIVGPDILKPDVTTPGVNILAAWPPNISPTVLSSDKRSVLFNIISGTSMSCPHVSGVAALLKSVHSDWSPAAIKSALMTTYTLDNTNAPISDKSSGISSIATPFAFGSGHIDPEKAADPGLVYDISTEVYLTYLCSLKYNSSQIVVFSNNFTCLNVDHGAFQPGDLNYPSFAVLFKHDSQPASVSYRRTTTNVGISRSTYVAHVKQADGVSVRVEPEALEFQRIGQKLSYKVTITKLKDRNAPDNHSFGSVSWISMKHRVTSPIAVTWT